MSLSVCSRYCGAKSFAVVGYHLYTALLDNTWIQWLDARVDNNIWRLDTIQKAEGDTSHN